ncbi:DUF2381 family protein [Pyxidicoccus caerfyrddinensis]|uniref:DUF2381 family protein n=1 Tax=Pyxidicoccus caerfyrddinensis TaxID=2709663 RepID=UPI0013D9195E|nr:DUF2381 family protein [Pyxidicoccus caerfyrddinensis]
MFASPPIVLLALMLLDGSSAAKPGAAACQTGVQHVELPAVPTDNIPTVCISPGQGTTFSFDSDFTRESLALDGAENFTKVDAAQSTVKLVPSEKLVPGERLKLTVRFRDDEAPAGAALQLVVHAVQAATHVEVHREKRTVESCQRELREKDAALQQCRADNERLRTERSGPGGIVALRASGLMDSDGVVASLITKSVTEAATNALRASGVTAYRAAMRVAVEVFLVVLEDAPPWKPESATLTLQGTRGVELKVLTVWLSEPMVPGSMGISVFVEADAPADAPAGPFTLKLWDASGARTVTISGITFP